MSRSDSPYEGRRRKQYVDVTRDNVTRKEIRFVGSNKLHQESAVGQRRVANTALSQILKTPTTHMFPTHLQHLLVDSGDIPEQLIELSADSTPNKNFVKPVENRPFSNKPRGGMWTATRTGQTSSTWSDWRENEDYSQHENVHIWAMENPEPGTLIKINSLEDFLSVIEEFPMKEPPDPNGVLSTLIVHPRLDYEKLMATGVNGIWLTSEGEHATRQNTNGPDLYGWDLECVLWLNVPETAQFKKLK